MLTLSLSGWMSQLFPLLTSRLPLAFLPFQYTGFHTFNFVSLWMNISTFIYSPSILTLVVIQYTYGSVQSSIVSTLSAIGWISPLLLSLTSILALAFRFIKKGLIRFIGGRASTLSLSLTSTLYLYFPWKFTVHGSLSSVSHTCELDKYGAGVFSCSYFEHNLFRVSKHIKETDDLKGIVQRKLR